jgi:hypothetical protein
MRSIILLLFLIFISNVFALTETDRQEAVNPNFYGSNAGFENGIKDITVFSAVKNWSSTKHLGNKGASCTTDTTNDYCETKLVANPQGASSLEWGFYYKTTSSTLKADIIDGSGNVVRTINPLPSTTDFTEAIMEFVGAASTSYKLRFTQTTAAASTIYFDSMHVSKYNNIGSVNLQDKEYDITTQVTGDNGWSTTYASARVIKDRSATPVWRVTGNIRGTSNNVGGGTTINVTIAGLTAKNTSNFTQSCVVGDSTNFTTGRCRIDPNTGVLNLDNASASTTRYVQFSFLLDSKPTWATDYAAEQVVRSENANQYATVRIARDASHKFTTSSSTFVKATDPDVIAGDRTNYNIAENTATVGDYAVKTSNLQPGVYEASVSGRVLTAADSECVMGLSDDGCTTVIATTSAYNRTGDANGAGTDSYASATFQYNVVQASKEISVCLRVNSGGGSCYLDNTTTDVEIRLEPKTPRIAMPQIINSVGTSYQGQTRLESVFSSGTGAEDACTSSPCTLRSNTGGISSVTRTAAGAYLVNFVSGTFSQSPVCNCSFLDAVNDYKCSVRRVDINTARIYTFDSSAFVDQPLSIICHGIK